MRAIAAQRRRNIKARRKTLKKKYKAKIARVRRRQRVIRKQIIRMNKNVSS